MKRGIKRNNRTWKKFVGKNDEEKIYTRIKKLIRLAASDNKHEAELATVKANNYFENII